MIALATPTEIVLYTSAWIGGTRATAYLGPVKAELWVPDAQHREWDECHRELLDTLRASAFALGANTVVAVEVSMDPWSHHPATGELGLHLFAIGTAACLEPLL